jgi:hypothetical protein
MSKEEEKKGFFNRVLLQPKFQLTFVVINWLCMLLTAVVCYYLITSTFNDLEMIGQKMKLSSNSGYMRFLRSQENMFIGKLMVYLPIALFFGFSVTVFISHKVASPINKIKRYFQSLDWDYPDLLYFRDEDFFSDLAITINKSLNITERIEEAHLSGKAAAKKMMENKDVSISQNDVDKILKEAIANLSALAEERTATKEVDSIDKSTLDEGELEMMKALQEAEAAQKKVKKKVVKKKVVKKKVIKKKAAAPASDGQKVVRKVVKKVPVAAKATSALSANKVVNRSEASKPENLPDIPPKIPKG